MFDSTRSANHPPRGQDDAIRDRWRAITTPLSRAGDMRSQETLYLAGG
jgi:hypothetical protein